MELNENINNSNPETSADLHSKIAEELGIDTPEAIDGTIAAWAETHEGEINADDLIHAILLQAAAVYVAAADGGKNLRHTFNGNNKNKKVVALVESSKRMKEQYMPKTLIFEIKAAYIGANGLVQINEDFDTKYIDWVALAVYETAQASFRHILSGGIPSIQKNKPVQWGSDRYTYEAATFLSMERELVLVVAENGSNKDFQSLVMARPPKENTPDWFVTPSSICHIVKDCVLAAETYCLFLRFDRDELIHGMTAIYEGRGSLSDKEVAAIQTVFVERSLGDDLPGWWYSMTKLDVPEKAKMLGGMLKEVPSKKNLYKAKTYIMNVVMTEEEKENLKNLRSELLDKIEKYPLSSEEFSEAYRQILESGHMVLPVLGETDIPFTAKEEVTLYQTIAKKKRKEQKLNEAV